MTLQSSETVLPNTVKLSRIFISNVTGSNDLQVSQHDIIENRFQYFENITAKVVSNESTKLMILLSEAQRQKVLKFSSVGGFNSDGVGSILDVSEKAYKDVALNDNAASGGIPILEFEDIIPPKLAYAYLNFSDGLLTLYG